jgi:hypothetical protein
MTTRKTRNVLGLLLAALAAAWTAGCGDDDGADADAGTDADTDADTDSDTDADSDTDTDADGGPPGDGGEMNIDDTISDQAQSMTIAFDGLAFVTGSFCAQTFYPPGKVADFFGFQYLRDNDPTGMGHNTAFTTLTADPVLAMLSDDQLQALADLGAEDKALSDEYGYARFPLAMAFRRLYDGDTPSAHPDLSQDAVEAYSGYLFSIDGEMSYLRAQAYAYVLSSMTEEQKAQLMLVLDGAASPEWTALQPADGVVDEILSSHPASGGDLRTYAGEMLAWYVGGVDPDVYFCPERQGTYFGSFFMKDVKAMHIPDYTIDSNMTADMGNSFLSTLTTEQRSLVTDLVTTQKDSLLDIVTKRADISDALREFLASGSVDEATVLALSEEYGALDGAISYFYATAFSQVGETLTTDQATTLMALRKTATATDTEDFDDECTGAWLYSTEIAMPEVMSTDFMFGVCAAGGSTCSADWDCCSFSCDGSSCAG